jgi:hypothetical protein
MWIVFPTTSARLARRCAGLPSLGYALGGQAADRHDRTDHPHHVHRSCEVGFQPLGAVSPTHVLGRDDPARHGPGDADRDADRTGDDHARDLGRGREVLESLESAGFAPRPDALDLLAKRDGLPGRPTQLLNREPHGERPAAVTGVVAEVVEGRLDGLRVRRAGALVLILGVAGRDVDEPPDAQALR